MSKHTPGPWRYRVGDEWSHSIVTDHGMLPDGSPSSWTIASVNHRREEKEANARLIAAAPELLEALKWMLARVNRLAPHNASEGDAALYEIASAMAAIKKAEGTK